MTQPVCHNFEAPATGYRPATGALAFRFLRGLVDGMRCGIAAADRSGRLMMLNEVGRQILGLNGRATVGRPVGEALAGFPQLSQILTEAFAMTSLANRAELDIHPPGSTHGKTIGFTLSMVDGEDGEPIGVAVFFKDLTQIEHKEEQERLKERLAALGQMAASLAHEIRNPLASIEVTCSLLRRRLGEAEESRGMLDKIAAEVKRLNRTITSSLEFVRPLTPTLAPGGLAALLDEAIAIAMERRGGSDVEILCRVQDDMPAFLMDRAQLRQVFENLVLNAVEAVDGRGRVRIDAEVVPAPSAVSIPYRPDGGCGDVWQRFDHFAVVRVSDSGPGIPAEDRGKIFYPFFTTKEHGSGVGLSMVRKIVDSHRGLIDIDEGPDGGAMFTVRLPMVLSALEESRT